MEQLTPPEPQDLDSSNLANTWQKWRQRFELFTLVSRLSKKDAKIQLATLLQVAWLSCFGSVQHIYLGK